MEYGHSVLSDFDVQRLMLLPAVSHESRDVFSMSMRACMIKFVSTLCYRTVCGKFTKFTT